MRQTYTHILSSGIEVEFKRMMSYHQEWLSKGKTQKSTKVKTNKSDKNIDDVLADILTRVGSKNIENYTHAEKLQIVQGLLSVDMKEALMAARFFSVDLYFAERQAEYKAFQKQLEDWKLSQKIKDGEVTKDTLSAEVDYEYLLELSQEDEPEYKSSFPDHIFSFNYKFTEKDENGLPYEIEHQYDMPVHFHEFTFTAPYMGFTEVPTELEKQHELTLPVTKQQVRWTMLTVDLENKFKGQINPETIHINSPIEWRNPVVLEAKKDGGTIPVKLNTSKMELLDIEVLRKDIYVKEGKANTTIKIKHPNSEALTTVDILQVVTFFIPSGVA